ncbi:MAG: VWA domain-containing protein [Christensenella sp.]
MGKKFIAIAIAALLACLQLNVAAADVTSLHIEQAYANMPDIEAYIYKTNADNELLQQTGVAKENISATYGGKALTVTGVDEEFPIAYFYLLDVSSSVSNAMLEEIKAAVSQQIDLLNDKDKIAVVTFGENVKLICETKDTKENAKAKIQQIKSGENATRLYDGLSQILNYISTNKASLPHRKVLMLITDGVDVYKGGSTQGEVLSQLDNAGLSLYSLGIDKAEKKYLDSLGELARASGGRNYILESSNVSKSISSVVKFVNNVLCVKLAANNNLVVNEKKELKLDITIDDEVQTVQKTFAATEWQKDETKPYVVSASVQDVNELSVVFSEPVELAQGINAISIKDEKGKLLQIESIRRQDKTSAELLMSDEIYNGNYEMVINDAVDISMEKNKISQDAVNFTMSTNKKDLRYFWSHYSKVMIISTAIVILLIAGVVISIVVMSSKKKQIEETIEKSQAEHKINAIDTGKKLLIFASVAGRENHKLSVELTGTLIIGRSEKTSDITFNDKGLSRQHCALLLDGDRVLVRDLDSANGTYVNGIRLECARTLYSGDKINISDTEITIEM